MNIRKYLRQPRYPLLVALAALYPLLVALAALFLIVVITAQGVLGEDSYPDAPDSAFIDTGSFIVDEQTARENLARKEATAAENDAAKEAAQQAWESGDQVKRAPDVAIPSYPESEVEIGIFPDAGPLPSGWGSLYRLQNRWQGRMGGKFQVAAAGLKTDGIEPVVINEPAQGILIITVVPNGEGIPYHEFYNTPIRAGAVRITSIDGPCLYLASTTTSATFVFDLIQRSWDCQVMP